MGFFKKQFLSVIEWKDSSNDIIVYRYPLTDRDEIMNSSTLVVRESQVAMFIHKGEIADVFGPGTYKLSTENIPFLTKLLSLSTLGNSRIKAEVYFVNTKRFMGLKWGTQNPIMMRDVDFGNIRLRGYGTFAFKVEDASKFMKEVFGGKLPDILDDETLNTINKFFDNSLNISETSRQLFLHRNTLVYRLEKIQKSTGLDVRVFDDALTFNIALMVSSYMEFMKTQD